MSAQDDIGSFTSLSGNRLNNPNSLRFCDWTGELFQDLGKQTSIPFTNEFKFQAVIPIYKGFIFGTSLYSTLQQQTNVTALSSTGNLGRFWGLSAGTLYPKNCVGCTPGARVFPTGFVLGQGGQTVSLAPPMSVLTDRLTQLDLSMKKTFKFGERFRLEPTMQVFNVLNVGTATLQSASLGADAAPYLPSSACGSLATPNAACGLGGLVNATIPPRLIRVALLFHF